MTTEQHNGFTLDSKGKDVLKSTLKVWLQLNDLLVFNEHRIHHAKVKSIEKQCEEIIKKITKTPYGFSNDWNTPIVDQIKDVLDGDKDYPSVRLVRLQMWMHAIIRKIGVMIKDEELDKTCPDVSYYRKVYES